MDSYDLFSAMSGAAEDLVSRSDYRVKHNNQVFTTLLTVAACLSIVVIGTLSLLPRTGPELISTQPTTAAYESEPIHIDVTEPLKLNGRDVGTLNIVQLSQVEEVVTMPEFLMYIDPENFYLADDGKSFYIYQRVRTENKPACWLTLTWKPNTTVEQALQQQSTDLRTRMENITVFETNPLLNGPMIQGSSGSAWDSAQTEVYIISGQHNGVFIFTLEYYLEDADGYAVQLRDMLQTFEVITDDSMMPGWMASLRSAANEFTYGFLKNDFSEMQDLISDHAEIYTYDADVLAEARVLKTHFTVDDDTNPKSATVSVRHKYLDADAYDYITMELQFTDGKWQVSTAGIER